MSRREGRRRKPHLSRKKRARNGAPGKTLSLVMQMLKQITSRKLKGRVARPLNCRSYHKRGCPSLRVLCKPAAITEASAHASVSSIASRICLAACTPMNSPSAR